MGKSISETHEWRAIEDFKEGDSIRGRSKDMLVTGVKVEGKLARLFYIEDGHDKVHIDKVGAEYVAQKCTVSR